MLTREASAQALRFDLGEAHQQLAEIDVMIADMGRLADELAAQIRIEQDRQGIRDINHFAYPTSARAAQLRRDNLLSSIGDLEARRSHGVAQIAALEDGLAQAEQPDARQRFSELDARR